MNRQHRRAAERAARKQQRKQARGPLTAAPANELIWSPGAREALGIDNPPPGIGPARAIARMAHDIAHQLFNEYAENEEAFAEDLEDLQLDCCPGCGVDLVFHQPAPNGALFGFEHPKPICPQQGLVLDELNAQLLVLTRHFETECEDDSAELESRGVA